MEKDGDGTVDDPGYDHMTIKLLEKIHDPDHETSTETREHTDFTEKR